MTTWSPSSLTRTAIVNSLPSGSSSFAMSARAAWASFWACSRSSTSIPVWSMAHCWHYKCRNSSAAYLTLFSPRPQNDRKLKRFRWAPCRHHEGERPVNETAAYFAFLARNDPDASPPQGCREVRRGPCCPRWRARPCSGWPNKSTSRTSR
jgi:hypothetical protein